MSSLAYQAEFVRRGLHRGDDKRPLCTGRIHVFPARDFRCTCMRRGTDVHFRYLRIEGAWCALVNRAVAHLLAMETR